MCVSVHGLICGKRPKLKVPHEDASLSIQDLHKYDDDRIKQGIYGVQTIINAVLGRYIGLFCIAFPLFSGPRKKTKTSYHI